MNSFYEFWPYYLSEHRLPRTRLLHFVGSTLALILVAVGIWKGLWLLIAIAIICGYGFAWLGHVAVEKNKPASFRYPLYSFIADWKMWALMLTGKLDAELLRLGMKETTNHRGTAQRSRNQNDGGTPA